MTTHSSGEKPGIDEIEADIARTREELADTVDALAARLDVKTRVQDRVKELRDRPEVVGAAGVLAATVVVTVALVIWRRKR